MGARSQALGDLLGRTAARKPDKLALVNGELRWSYRELDQAVNRAAASLSRRGLSQGDRLALVSHNSWHYVVLAYATARIGAILGDQRSVPLSAAQPPISRLPLNQQTARSQSSSRWGSLSRSRSSASS